MTMADRETSGPVETLPERTRLLHIGLMKTGTTALQRAASSRRKTLLRHGVRYPGKHYNHRQAALALMNRTAFSQWRTRPPEDEWTALLNDVEQDRARRIWISNEFICGCDEPTAQRFLDDLGPRVHVVVTVRSVAATLLSLWQQYLKSGSTQDLSEWLASVLDESSDPSTLPANYSRNDQGEVVSRWAKLAGADKVTVVVADKAHPHQVQGAFETMLVLPGGTLDLPRLSGSITNRSFSAAEASLFLQINRLLPAGKMTRDEIIRILQGGAMDRVLDERRPPNTDQRLALPTWANLRASELGHRYAEVIADSGVNVVGDLAELSRVPDIDGTSAMTPMIPVELAAEAVIGAMSAGLHRGSHFVKAMPEPTRPSGWFPGRGVPSLRIVRRIARVARGTSSRIRGRQLP